MVSWQSRGKCYSSCVKVSPSLTETRSISAQQGTSSHAEKNLNYRIVCKRTKDVKNARKLKSVSNTNHLHYYGIKGGTEWWEIHCPVRKKAYRSVQIFQRRGKKSSFFPKFETQNQYQQRIMKFRTMKKWTRWKMWIRESAPSKLASEEDITRLWWKCSTLLLKNCGKLRPKTVKNLKEAKNKKKEREKTSKDGVKHILFKISKQNSQGTNQNLQDLLAILPWSWIGKNSKRIPLRIKTDQK